MKALMLAAVVGIGSLFVTGSAEAGHGHHGHGHLHRHSRHVHLPRYSFPRPIYGSSWYRSPSYHDTTHLDYHPPTLYRHGSHYHVMPGHYDLHRSGHWHH